MCSNGKTTTGTLTIDRSNAKRTLKSYVAVWLWIGWMSFYFFFVLSLPLLYMYAKGVLSVIIGLIVISAFSTIRRDKQPKWAYKFGEWIMDGAGDYFKTQMIVEDEEALAAHSPVIFGLEPHDVLPLSIFSFNNCMKGLKGQNTLGCVTSACFKVPLMRHFYTWVNATSVDKKSVNRMLEKGISPVICPGGVQEVTLMTDDSECVLYLKSRMGFVKLALQHGVPLVPAFSFGLRDSYTFWIPRSKFMKRIARKLGFLPMMFFGMFGIPLGPAKPCRYSTVIGKPILVPKVPDPKDEDLKKYHTLFIEEMTRIYEAHKADYGMQDVTLRIA